MSEVTNELMFEVLKAMQKDLRDVKTGQTELREEFGAMRGHMLAMQRDIANIYDVLGRHEVRLDRIEKRLELHEPAE